MSKKVVIIGSGLGGFASACLLAKEGFEVEVYEKNEQLGGRASTFIHKIPEGDFLFDMGPSWYLMPDIFERFFESIGKKVSDRLNLQRLNPNYRIYFEEIEGFVDIFAKPEDNCATFEKLEPGSSKTFQEFLKKSEYQYEVAIKEFVYKNYDSVLDFLNLRMATEGLKLKVFQNMHKNIKKYFKSSAMQKIMEYTLVSLGSSPYKTPALYSIMSHVDFNLGVFYPQGGISEIVKALYNIGKKLGVKYFVNASVSEILLKKDDKSVYGIRVDGERQEILDLKNSFGFDKVLNNEGSVHDSMIEADIVVSNANYNFTESLLPENKRAYSDTYWDSRKMAPGAFLVYLGYKGELPQLEHHTLYFSHDWDKNFNEIFEESKMPENPSLYICNASKTDANSAPKGYENIFLLAPIAPTANDDKNQRKHYKDHLYNLINKKIGIDLQKNLEFDYVFTNSDFKSRYNSFKGSALGLSHNLFQTAIFRPQNYSKKVKGLFFVGADTNPGIGMPMVLISAELVKERILKMTK